MNTIKFLHVPLVFGLLLLSGLLTFNHYGESWDDKSLQKYAVKSLNAYTTWPQQGVVQLAREDLGYYGPFYVMLVERVTASLQSFLPFSRTDLRHLVYFLTCAAGVLAFYGLAKRWMSDLPALGATLLFATQPVLWGHAFVNPKDTPFLSLFLLSLYFGFKQFDRLNQDSTSGPDKRSRRISTIVAALWLVSVFALYLFPQAVQAYIERLVLSAQAGGENILSLAAKNIHGTTAERYIQRYFTLFLQFRTGYFIFSILILLLVWYRLTPHLPADLFTILLPAVLLGFTTSTRILGPFAGVLVALHALRSRGWSVLPAILLYAVAAMMAAYATWPYLWMDPVGRFYESLREMSLYPWNGLVLFNGVAYHSTTIPFTYLPVLLALQLTEPVWILSLAGWGVSMSGAGRGKKNRLMELSVVWFILPLILFIALRIPLYDNFRQIFFLLPPVFLMAGTAFERIRQKGWQSLVIALSLIPGVVGIFSLYPYEYMYYNGFIGGVNGASDRYELDYWGLSYREAAEAVNELAAPNASIWIEAPSHLFALFAREDLKLYSPSEVERAESYAFVVALTRYNFDETSHPGAEVVYQVRRGKAVLAVVKKP